jgi:tetratricopeptide (TPR) repeat protein
MRHLWLLVVWALAALASPAFAQEDARAQAAAVFAEAGTALEAHDYERAAELYQRAGSLFPTPTAAYWHGKSLDALMRLIAARERYAEAAGWPHADDEPESYARARELAARELRQVDARIPTGPAVSVTETPRAQTASRRESSSSRKPASLSGLFT